MLMANPNKFRTRNTRNEAKRWGTDEELVDAHAGINRDLPAEIALKLLLLHGLGGVIREEFRQTLAGTAGKEE